MFKRSQIDSSQVHLRYELVQSEPKANQERYLIIRSLTDGGLKQIVVDAKNGDKWIEIHYRSSDQLIALFKLKYFNLLPLKVKQILTRFLQHEILLICHKQVKILLNEKELKNDKYLTYHSTRFQQIQSFQDLTLPVLSWNGNQKKVFNFGELVIVIKFDCTLSQLLQFYGYNTNDIFCSFIKLCQNQLKTYEIINPQLNLVQSYDSLRILMFQASFKRQSLKNMVFFGCNSKNPLCLQYSDSQQIQIEFIKETKEFFITNKGGGNEKIQLILNEGASIQLLEASEIIIGATSFILKKKHRSFDIETQFGIQ